ncbi:MAG TPA: gliding motility-associated ABC transporter substrate-binding protein GldG [Bacteroidales bacterium]|nr:gliding motility-associated ABC transporter substrate-binding protein GldG [Bacteroidales bacterium]HSA43534.1 gliding motility-associated ABC transporter substrate-binding protein GldG [Bacteroidales bacterium]
MGKIGRIIGLAQTGTKNSQKKNLRRQAVMQLLLLSALLILLNLISSFIFTRIDLTAEKRFTLSPATRQLLRELDDVVFFRVYLDGEFPAGFKRLRNETREMLDEFRAYSDNIQYEFINPSAAKNNKDRNDLYRQLIEKGLAPTNLQVRQDDGTSQQIIFPGALARHKEKEAPIQLLLNQINTPPEEILNLSVQNLEYNLANAVRKLHNPGKHKVAFIQGQGELGEAETADIFQSLGDAYIPERVNLNARLNSLTERDLSDTNKVIIKNKYRALIIAKPDSAFDEKDKFLIDQFIMRGGRVLWLIDPVFASMDSLQASEETIGISLQLNLEDQLFRYGVRLNTNLVMDLSACPIPVKTGQIGNQPRFEFYPWYFFPMVIPQPVHPVVNSLNAIRLEFASTLDTVAAEGVKKQILLTSSPYSRTVNTPTLISLQILREQPDEKQYRGPGRPLAVLLEGPFQSLYSRRIPPEIAENKGIGFLESGEPTRMIVVADGDVIRNQTDHQRGVPYPLGYDRYTRETFGNKEFILNAIDYLCDDSGLISVRSREVRLRPLDHTRIHNDKLSIQLANTLLPVILVLGFAWWQIGRRNRKYARPKRKPVHPAP